MSCVLSRDRVHAWLDGELDAADAAELRAHVHVCPECAAERSRALALRDALRERGRASGPPPGLEARVRRSLRTSGARPRRHLREVLALAAAVAFGFVLGRFLVSHAGGPASGPGTALVEAHVRALSKGPLVEVLSSDTHAVKPWFAGRLDFSPKVKDLGAEGFPLEGGRVDLVGARPAAALVYRHGRHVVELFVTMAPGGPAPSSASVVRGFSVLTWTEGDLAYAAVSDANPAEVAAFAEAVRR